MIRHRLARCNFSHILLARQLENMLENSKNGLTCAAQSIHNTSKLQMNCSNWLICSFSPHWCVQQALCYIDKRINGSHMAQGMSVFGSDWNISTTAGWITVTFCADIHPTYGEPLTFSLGPWGQTFFLIHNQKTSKTTSGSFAVFVLLAQSSLNRSPLHSHGWINQSAHAHTER